MPVQYKTSSRAARGDELSGETSHNPNEVRLPDLRMLSTADETGESFPAHTIISSGVGDDNDESDEDNEDNEDDEDGDGEDNGAENGVLDRTDEGMREKTASGIAPSLSTSSVASAVEASSKHFMAPAKRFYSTVKATYNTFKAPL